MGHFVSSPREREKRYRRDSRGVERGPGEKEKMNKSEETDNTNKRQKDCLWKKKNTLQIKNGSLGFIETLHKQQ